MSIHINDFNLCAPYEYKTKPYAHQAEIFINSRNRKFVGFFMDMGTGKTKICIDTAAYLWKDEKIRNLIIVAPKGVYLNWKTIEVPKHMPDDVPLYECTWPFRNREEIGKFENLFMSKNDDKLRVIYMNVEALSTEKGGHFAITFCKYAKGGIMSVLDESTSIKNPGAKRTKMWTLATKDVDYKRIASGLPSPQSPVDLFSQLRHLDPYALPTQSYYAFRNRYCVMREVRLGPRRFNKIVGFQRMDELHGIMEKVGYRVLKKDCLDLPDKIYMTRMVPLSDDQQKAYDALTADTMILINDEQRRGVMTAPLMMTRLLRLHQIACGHMALDGGEIIDLSTPRLEALLEVLDEMEPPVIIWATYRHDIKRIVDLLRDEHGEKQVGHFYGDTSDRERVEVLRAFHAGELKYFVGNPSTGGFGLSLTKSHNVVYYSNSYNLEHRLQSEDRTHRIGQDSSVTYVDLIAPNTVDEKIVTALRNKETLAKILLDQGAEFFRQ